MPISLEDAFCEIAWADSPRVEGLRYERSEDRSTHSNYGSRIERERWFTHHGLRYHTSQRGYQVFVYVSVVTSEGDAQAVDAHVTLPMGLDMCSTPTHVPTYRHHHVTLDESVVLRAIEALGEAVRDARIARMSEQEKHRAEDLRKRQAALTAALTTLAAR